MLLTVPHQKTFSRYIKGREMPVTKNKVPRTNVELSVEDARKALVECFLPEETWVKKSAIGTRFSIKTGVFLRAFNGDLDNLFNTQGDLGNVEIALKR